jgi:osomolarity two-component system sensor histidine kinase SLN1
MESGMDFFLSKPIRRPALKHVLKTYCPPIIEEEEGDKTPPADTPSRPNTAKPKSKSKPKPKPKQTPPPYSMTTTARRDESPAVSPATDI